MSVDVNSRFVRLFLPVLLAACSMIGPFSIDTAFPAFEEMGRDFGAGTDSMQLVVSAYLFSFGLMSLFHGPISDAIGRKPVMVAGVLVYTLASVGCALSPNLGVLVFFRCLQGLSAGGGVIVSRTLVRDVYDGPEAQRLMATVMMIFGLAPALAPIVGGWILHLGSWHLIFWFLTAFGGLLTLAIVVLMPETHPVENRIRLTPSALIRELWSVATSGRFLRTSGAGVLAFAGWFIYVSAAAIIVFELLHKGQDDFWISFVPLIGGAVLGAWVSRRAAGVVSDRRLVTIGIVIALVGAVINAVIAATPATQTLPWLVIGPALPSFGASIAYPSIQIALFDLFPHARGAAASGFTFMQLVLNSVIASALVPFVDQSSATLALTCLVITALSVLLWMWVRRVDQPPGADQPLL